MVESPLRTNRRASLELLSPLHVGSGAAPLLSDYDFTAHRGEVWVMDQTRLQDRYSDEELRHGIPEIRLSMRLKPEEYPEYAAYSLPAMGAPGNEILPCIKQVDGRPYLPGSSLKGALRTVIGWAAARDGRAPAVDRMDRSAKYAAGPWERGVFGPSPNLDIMRALLVDDTGAMPLDTLELATVSVYSLRGPELQSKGPGYRFSIEALKPGSILSCRIGVAEGTLSHPALRMAEKRHWIDGICGLGRERAAELIGAEIKFYADCRMQQLSQFYQRLLQVLEGLEENQLLVQMSWGTGWNAKTLGSALSGDQGFPDVRDRYRLGRPGAPFPKSRRLVERGGIPTEPMGWVKVTL